MKKLIVLSVVFALVATAAFAVDLGGTVIGTVNLFSGQSGDNASDDIIGSGAINRFRIEGGGEAGDGKFGGMYRFDIPSVEVNEDKAKNLSDPSEIGDVLTITGVSGNAWWKPIDQLKLLIGNNGGDGFYGKEGITGWGFYQTVSDTGIVDPGNAWYSTYTGPVKFRNAFYGGDGGGNALRLEVTPIDILGINIVLPYFDKVDDGNNVGDLIDPKVEDVFKHVTAQIDLKLDFGNIALTYAAAPDAGDIYVYYGGSFGDLAIDFGFGYHLNDKVTLPIGIGVGVKYATDAFGVKFRLLANLGGDDKLTTILADVLPYFPLGDNLTAFVSVGLAMSAPDSGDTGIGWHFNPYLQIGEEWGSKFLVGVKVYSTGGWNPYGPGSLGDKQVNWTVPVSLIVNF